LLYARIAELAISVVRIRACQYCLGVLELLEAIAFPSTTNGAATASCVSSTSAACDGRRSSQRLRLSRAAMGRQEHTELVPDTVLTANQMLSSLPSSLIVHQAGALADEQN
jgi:hypothetical protein